MGSFEALEAGDPRQAGRYRIVARLGAGGMGRVYLGRSPGGRAVAVKMVRPELAEDEEFRRRFAREVAAARRVNGAFTAGVVDADPEGSPPWLATVYVPGLSLAEAVAAHGPWPQEPVLALGAGLAEGLEVIHAAGVVHRDLKPSNVLLAADGPRVIDFGISLASEASVLTQPGMTAGTPGFMSPEQLTARALGPACDVFALGAVLTFTATGVGPFGTGSAHALHFRTVYEEPDLGALSPVLRRVVTRCLAKEPDQRPSPAVLLDQLAEAAGGKRATPQVLTEADWMPRTVARTVQLRTTAPAPALRPEPASSPAPAPTPAPQPQTPPPTGDLAPTRHTIPEQDLTNLRPSSILHTSAPVGGATEPRPHLVVHPPGQAPSPSARPVAGPAGLSRRRVLLGLAGTATATGLGVAGWYLANSDDSGSPKWTFANGGSNYSSPLVSRGVVYVGGREASLYAVDSATGKQKWKFSTGQDAEAPSSMALADGLVYACGGKHLYAVDTATGKQRWKFPTGGNAYSPTAGDALVYVGSDEYLYAVDPATGKQRWKFRTGKGGVFRASPAVAGRVLYVGDTNNGLLYALDAITGEQWWESDIATVSGEPPVVYGGMVYFTSFGGQLYAVDTIKATTRWVFTNGGGRSPAVANGVVYVGSNGSLYAVDAATGKQRWTFPTGSRAFSSPVVSDGVVYVATSSDDKYLYAVDAATGKQKWKFPTHEAASRPAVSGGLVYVSTWDQLYAVPV
ncbi:PQQ-binding-like beta-propeller repeat protein [Streptomyces sp. NPDC049627]|uniref:outer membrane protein assembly factor BamB family protein n=1 Tax=Streptomyces sp. NPDC049627 TaxID=3365595 RepID=UPI0037AF5510